MQELKHFHVSRFSTVTVGKLNTVAFGATPQSIKHEDLIPSFQINQYCFNSTALSFFHKPINSEPL